MKNLKYIILSCLGLITLSCDNDELDELRARENGTTTETLPELTSGEADFSNYVAVGASFTAGVTDAALFIATQENSFPNTIATQFANVGGGTFNQPLMNDNIGNFITQKPRLYFYTDPEATDEENLSGPVRLGIDPRDPSSMIASPTTNPTTAVTGSFGNYGIPGARSIDLTTAGYGQFNPYFGRIASAPTATVIDDAVAQNPTFFTLSEIGGNDVLGYATSGGDADAENFTPITAIGEFNDALNELVTKLTENDAKGAIANVPDITSLAFFTTVPNNALVLDETSAVNLTGFFQAVSGIFAQVLISQGVPQEQALQLASQYQITFNEGANRFLIDVPETPTNPLGFRQMTENELLLLTIDQRALKQGYGSVVLTPEVLQVLEILQTGGTPTPEQAQLVLDAVSAIDNNDALDETEIAAISTATMAYNTSIVSVASSNNLALVDLNSVLAEAYSSGIQFDDFFMNTDLVFGGLVSLDGIHLTARGYALMANEFLKAIDATYGSNFVASGNVAKAGDYPTNYSPTLQ